MTATNPHPFANPLNQSRFQNYAYGKSQTTTKPVVTHPSNPKDLTIPDATPYASIMAEQQRQLAVPNQDIPYFNGPVPAAGFIGKTSLFKLSDGTMIDLQMQKIVYDPSTKWKAKGYWNDPNASIDEPTDKEWGPTESIESMLNRIGKPDGTYNDPNLSPESIRYWKKANEESKKLEQDLTDEQKQLLADLNSGKLFPLTKLEDEK